MKRTSQERGLHTYAQLEPETDEELRELLEAPDSRLQQYIEKSEARAREVLKSAGIDAGDLFAWEKHPDGGKERRFARLKREAPAPEVYQAIDVLLQARVLSTALRRSRDRDACGAILAGIHLAQAVDILQANLKWRSSVEARRKSNKNLSERRVVVTDDQILAVVNNEDYPTRERQANRLGIRPRQLQRRLRRLTQQGRLTDR